MRLSFILLSLVTRKRVGKFFQADLVRGYILLQLIPYIFLYCLLITPYRVHIVAAAPEMSVPYLYLRFACRSKIIRLLFPFRYPITSDTLYFGGIFTYRCM